MEWKTIDTAPKDGTEVIAAKQGTLFDGQHFPYPLTSRFVDGKWCAEFSDGWGSYDPQPTHWKPTPTRTEPPSKG